MLEQSGLLVSIAVTALDFVRPGTEYPPVRPLAYDLGNSAGAGTESVPVSVHEFAAYAGTESGTAVPLAYESQTAPD